jgi:4-oxalomesaconate tautomerase
MSLDALSEAGIPVMWMRGGTSKGGYFLQDDLPEGRDARDAVLLAIMGSPDPRQIDGMGGADSLTSKVAVVSPSRRDGIDVDYLFLQVAVEAAQVSDTQTCGNILAGVGPFAIERGLVAARQGETPVTIHNVNTGQVTVARVATPGGHVTYRGQARIDGVPGGAAPVPLEFRDTAGASCGALLPTGRPRDVIDGLEVTLIDNGMPCVLLRASDLGVSGQERPAELEANAPLRARLERVRLVAGPLMNLGDVTEKTVPKMTLLATDPPAAVATRSFIPHRCHKSIGVLAAVSVATALATPGTVGRELARGVDGAAPVLDIGHPSGALSVRLTISGGDVTRAEVLRTARKLMDGRVFPRADGA